MTGRAPLLTAVHQAVREALAHGLGPVGFRRFPSRSYAKTSDRVAMYRDDGDRTDLVEATLTEQDHSVRVGVMAGVDFRAERALIADRVGLDDFTHGGYPTLCIHYGPEVMRAQVQSEASLPRLAARFDTAIRRRVLPWLRGVQTSDAVRKKLVREDVDLRSLRSTRRYPMPQPIRIENAMAISLVLNDLNEARRLLGMVVDEYIACDPGQAFSKDDPPWWAMHLWQTLSWSMRHALIEETPADVLEWMQRCASVQPNLAAALGFFGQEAMQAAEQAGHYRLPGRFMLEAMVPKEN